MTTEQLKKLFSIDPYEDVEEWSMRVIAFSEREAMEYAKKDNYFNEIRNELKKEEIDENPIISYEIKGDDISVQIYPLGIYHSNTKIEERQAFLDGVFDSIKTYCNWCGNEFDTNPDDRNGKEIVCEDCRNDFYQAKENALKQAYIDKGLLEWKVDSLVHSFKLDFQGITTNLEQLSNNRLELESIRKSKNLKDLRLALIQYKRKRSTKEFLCNKSDIYRFLLKWSKEHSGFSIEEFDTKEFHKEFEKKFKCFSWTFN